MKIIVNGDELVLTEAISVDQLLASQQVEMANYVTIQINDEWIDRENFAATLLKDGDQVEFLYFMGGGRA
ncbi:sulfur carrier protein ThiS [Propionispora hippei]|uniref:Sulfur carrier protein n=1 Tax=Propionispora hippei DSM 15287 TaxID=1123003 RepID=A0A1M6HH05_9FIRM|nr:sulfur carrier protein ThiS [Propionispora hippei]SHJ21478.1 sulfur carrier protein [Propionispora hippei DSM 15287]